MKNFITYFLSFLVIFLLSLFVYSNVINNTLLKKDYISNIINESDYYTDLDIMLKEDLSELIPQSGFDDNILDNIYSIEDLKEETNNIINAIYDGSTYNINIDNFKARLNKYINNYISTNKIVVTKDVEKQIDKFINNLSRTYQEDVAYSTNLINSINNKLKKISIFMQRFIHLLLVASIILILVMLIIVKKDIISYLALISLSLGLNMFIPIIYESKVLNLENKIVLNISFNDIITELLIHLKIILGILALIFIVMSTILYILDIKKKK